MPKFIICSLLFAFTAIQSTAQNTDSHYVEPSIRDFVDINPLVRLHYGSTNFSVDGISVFDKYSLLYSQTRAKLYLIDNEKHLVQDEWDFQKDGKVKLITTRYTPEQMANNKPVTAWKTKQALTNSHFQTKMLPDSGFVILGQVFTSGFKLNLLGVAVRNGKISAQLVPLERKNLIPNTTALLYGKKNSSFSINSYLKHGNEKLFTMPYYPSALYSFNQEIISHPKIQNILIKQDSNGNPSILQSEPYKKENNLNEGQLLFRLDGKIMLYENNQFTITPLNERFKPEPPVELAPELEKLFRTDLKYGFVNQKIFKDEKRSELWVSFATTSEPAKQIFNHFVRVEVGSPNPIREHCTITSDRALQFDAQYLHNGHLYFKAKPTDTDYFAIFAIDLTKIANDTLALHRANSVTITLFKRELLDFSISHTSKYEPLPAKVVKVLGLKNNNKPTPNSLQNLADKALGYLKNKQDLEFAQHLCLYDPKNTGRLNFLVRIGEMKNVPVFGSDSERELLIMLMEKLKDDITDVELEQKSGFIEATTPAGWRFILIKGKDGYRFGSVFSMKFE